jgi:glycosyltransferase involved in cell wall biosynthesis
MTPKRIVYLWDADYPWDVRTEKSCLALTQAGHEVHIVARNKQWRPTMETLPEGRVHRMPPWRWSGQRIDGVLGFPAFFSPRWRSLLSRIVREVRAEMIIARDIPLCPTAVHVGRRHGVPVILDMAENYPAMMRDLWIVGRHRPIDYAVRNPRLVQIAERYCLEHVQHILTVVEESSNRLAGLGVDPKRMTVVSNTPPISRVQKLASSSSSAGSDTGRSSIDVVYLGLLEVPRGVLEMINAVAQLAENGFKQFRLQIIGDGRDAALFRKRAAQLGLGEERVQFYGRLPYPEALTLVARADIGVISHHANESWNTTIPNKLFDYMAAGLPVVSSDTIPCARILRETGAGELFRSGDSADLANALIRLIDPSRRLELGNKGRSAIVQHYNWEHDSAALLEIVTSV